MGAYTDIDSTTAVKASAGRRAERAQGRAERRRAAEASFRSTCKVSAFVLGLWACLWAVAAACLWADGDTGHMADLASCVAGQAPVVLLAAAAAPAIDAWLAWRRH